MFLVLGYGYRQERLPLRTTHNSFWSLSSFSVVNVGVFVLIYPYLTRCFCREFVFLSQDVAVRKGDDRVYL